MESRNILLTGGTGNIGVRLLADMVKDGHFVYFTSRSIESGNKIMKSLFLQENQAKCIVLNFDALETVEEIHQHFDNYPDTIIHNARSLDTLKLNKKGRVTFKQFQDEFRNGITIPYLLTNKLLDAGANIKDILFISSMYGNVAPNPSLYKNFEQQSPINYGVVKAAQLHLTKELAVRLASKNIRVNAISYGGVEGRVDKEFKERYAKLTPSGRMLNHTDLYPPVQYVLKNKDLNITGENLKIDGGWTIW